MGIFSETRSFKKRGPELEDVVEADIEEQTDSDKTRTLRFSQFSFQERDFNNGIELYEFYIRILIQGNLFAVAINGAVVSYVLKEASGNSLLLLALILPAVLSFSVFLLCARSMGPAKNFKKNMENLHFEIGYKIVPLMVIFPWMLRISWLFHLLTVIGLIMFGLDRFGVFVLSDLVKPF